ncbi:tRNA uridine(34) 5-carboxymethylaminomethyl modification radical SAM/GNAT enzyme Elp3 [Sulfuracidifex metallicus]|uniref:tRNA uridine(34) 5-carboxymethylaminomethyl modification radical SAM/GNAT enzyme Elp3 n=1 Tax=Sulfuracidifex metallicus TaxID=47303 RepID=UPI0022757123|nr:elongator complex protein 3 [Sulfuracidifex metallicus]MCY0850506.1 tRNA uridine(34) 5-carboxymethylaminomethyl modification radical SAM/GNAT enzyme Elp3 [Sulfuracidifex metallicus]
MIRKMSRLMSGVTIVSIMTHPHRCPHGKCIFCPGGVDYGTPQSYYGREPTLMRAIENNYHPYLQVNSRLSQYVSLGHVPSKVELIIMGGTFLSTELDYQEWFVSQALEAMNRFPSREKPGFVYLEDAQERNETSRVRCVGMTVETKPDWGKELHADMALRLGATKVELGVQTTYDELLLKSNRGHTTRDSVESTRILKDSGFKVVYHVMLGMPGSDPDKDLDSFKEMMTNQDFMPDMLKIYPTLVVESSPLAELWKKGEYQPYDSETLVDLISEMYRYIPPWVRVMRVQRDIPANIIIDGNKKGNLREMVEKEAERKGINIKEIRYREVGVSFIHGRGKVEEPEVVVRKYEASKGTEVFISLEDSKGILIGYLRLRVPYKSHRKEIDDKTSIVRELHVYGAEVPVEGSPIVDEASFQHKGYGKILLNEAERISLEFDRKKIAVLSGIGAREYYRRQGYSKEGPYMYKSLS